MALRHRNLVESALIGGPGKAYPRHMALDAAPARSIRIPRWLPYIGPAVAVSIGYIDPGNWASDLAASAFGCSLLWVIVAANAIAIVVQIAVTRITLFYGSDLGSLISRRWPTARLALWAIFQSAAIATDIAEFAGIVLGTELVFRIGAPLAAGIGLVVVFALLALLARKSLRMLDAVLGAALLGVAFVFVKLALASGIPATDVLRGTLVPALPGTAAIFVLVAIVGATVMPHNLFLHSSLVAKRVAGETASVQRSLRGVFAFETVVALNIATIVNIAIVVVGVSQHGRGDTIAAAFSSIHLAGALDPSLLFGVGLIVSGFAATITSTLAGDYICRSFGGPAISTFARRAVTVLPAAAVLGFGFDATTLLLVSQVALCLALPVVLLPIVLLLRCASRADARTGKGFLRLTFAASALCVAVDLVFLITSVT
jgi:manganese transport protein